MQGQIMQPTLKVWPIVASILIWGACNKAAPLPGSSTGINQSTVEAPSTESKSDRPTETGEGLPGYLIDPAKLVIESNAGTTSVTGAASAVRHHRGLAVNVNILLVKVSKKTSPLRRQNRDWQVDGTELARVQADTQGAFRIQGVLGTDDLLFIKVEDKAGAQVQYKAAELNEATLWIDGNKAQVIDPTIAEQIASQISSVTNLALLIEQIKTTGQCRNCNLSGADLSGLEIVNCDLSLSNLMGAKFVLSNVSGCNFANSNLSQADFTQANMAGANLTQTDITGAIFAGANTEGLVGQQIPAN